jgi:hypothetical protein
LITSSARNSGECGIVKLSANAILRSISPPTATGIPNQAGDATPLIAKGQPATEFRALGGDDPPVGKGSPLPCITAFALRERQVVVDRSRSCSSAIGHPLTLAEADWVSASDG